MVCEVCLCPYFDKAIFSGSAQFVKTTFTEIAYFGEATFIVGATSCNTTFAQGAAFFRATFRGDADFGNAEFAELVSFFGTVFQEMAVLLGVKFLDQAEFQATKFVPQAEGEPSADFELARFSKLAEIVFDNVDLSCALFDNCDISGLWFTSSVEWGKREDGGGQVVFEETTRLDNLSLRLKRKGRRDFWAVARIYQQLKKNYEVYAPESTPAWR